MKKAIVMAAFAASASTAFAQGTVVFANSPDTTIQTNSIAFGGTSGNTAGAIGSYYFELLTAPSTVTSVDANLQQLLTSPWSDTGLEATNTASGTGGRLAGSAGPGGAGAQANFWPPQTTNSFIVVGWSASLGTTWAQVASQLSGAHLLSGGGGSYWQGNLLVAGGFLGATMVGFAKAGDTNGFPAPLLFASTNNAQANPVTTTTTLWVTTVPEPSPFALIGLGAAVLMIFLGRKAAISQIG